MHFLLRIICFKLEIHQKQPKIVKKKEESREKRCPTWAWSKTLDLSGFKKLFSGFCLRHKPTNRQCRLQLEGFGLASYARGFLFDTGTGVKESKRESFEAFSLKASRMFPDEPVRLLLELIELFEMKNFKEIFLGRIFQPPAVYIRQFRCFASCSSSQPFC